jgi:hypothetical protein
MPCDSSSTFYKNPLYSKCHEASLTSEDDVYRASPRRAIGLLAREPTVHSSQDTEAGDHSQRRDGGPPPASSPLELPEASPDLFLDVRGRGVGCGLGPQHGLYGGPELETALACRASRHVVLHAAGLRRFKRSIEPRVKVSMWQGTPHIGLPPCPRGSHRPPALDTW